MDKQTKKLVLLLKEIFEKNQLWNSKTFLELKYLQKIMNHNFFKTHWLPCLKNPNTAEKTRDMLFSDLQTKSILNKFFYYLQEAQQLERSKEIIKSLIEAWNKEQGLQQIFLESAFEIEESTQKKIQQTLESSWGLKLDLVCEKNPNLLAGWRLTSKHKTWELSLVQTLQKSQRLVEDISFFEGIK
jgi:F0F1-type ATP synthase delta subunit